ncbi:IGHMBP2 family helicase [Candidatus Bipolaricaulota bacterium]|nr:IGHMBP2 family helicase [Candidatus Bipolaricaulota bacterium]
MHYLLIRGLARDTGVRDIIGALVNQTALTPENIGRVEHDETFAEVEILPDKHSYRPENIDSVGPETVEVVRWDQRSWEKIKGFKEKYQRLVQLEREEEMERHEREIRETSGREREKMGRALLHLRGKDVGEDLGGKRMVKFSRKGEGEKLPENELATGDLVMLSKKDPLREDNPTGTVAKQTSYSTTVAFDGKPEDFLLSNGLRMDLYVNDVTYRRMLKGLEKFPFHFNRELVEKLIGLSSIEEVLEVDLNLPYGDLDASQRKAIRRAVDAESFFCIHGPPGTGKTTTLAGFMEELVSRNEKVLATAASNTAVDNVVEFLTDRDLDVVRVGHPARVTPDLREVSLDYKIQENPRYQRSRKLREKAQLLQDEQDSYQFPSGRYRRGMSDSQIHQLARKGAGARGVSRSEIKEMSSWLKLQEEIDKLYERSQQLEEKAIDEIIDESDVVCTTNSTAGSSLLEGWTFDVVAIDEATQATEPSCLIPINKGSRVVMAGDHKQLPPTVLAEEAKNELQVTAFEKLVSREGNSITEMLLTQFRMNDKIMEFSDRNFYDGNLQAESSVANHTLDGLLQDNYKIDETEPSWFLEALGPGRPVSFLDTGKIEARERQRPGSTSRENPVEATIVSRLEKWLIDCLPPKNIGVISPYDDQIDLLNSRIDEENLEIKTVDGFQGREKEVIVISFVRSNEEDELGFLKDVRRLNVSLTRARRKLIMIGDSRTLSTHETYEKLIKFVRENDFYSEISQEPHVENFT